MPSAILSGTSYGKSRIRLVQVSRRGDRHEVRDLTVAVAFEGDYDTSYTDGDNRDVLPTDTMKNTVYALAARDGAGEPEGAGISVTAGIADLIIMKTSRSAFAGFPRDEYTTLPETNDRLLATALTATWTYHDTDIEFGPMFRTVRAALLDAFAVHDSRSVQHTLYAMGEVVLGMIDPVDSISLEMPNRHHLPIDLSRFGMENRNEIFVATEEPYGLIKATLSR